MPVSYYDIPGLAGDVESADDAGKRHVVLRHVEDDSYDKPCYSDANACLARIKAFANGAIFEISRHPGLDEATKQQHLRKVKGLVARYENLLRQKRKLTPYHLDYHQLPSYASLLRDFFFDDLPKASGLSQKAIVLGEAMWAWQVYQRPATRTTIERVMANGKRFLIVQHEETLNTQLTEAQRNELVKVHAEADKDLPKWFKKLRKKAPGVALALKEIVPNEVGGDWEACEKCRPAILRYIPGQANATRHRHVMLDQSKLPTATNIAALDWHQITELMLAHPGAVVSDTSALRQGAPSAFDMTNEDERVESAAGNLQQLINAFEPEDVKTKFSKFWGIDSGEIGGFKIPILLGGLLTPKDQAGLIGYALDSWGLSGKQNNTRLTREKHTVANGVTVPTGFVIHDVNVAVNNLRATELPAVHGQFLTQLVRFNGFFTEHPPSNEAAKKHLRMLEKIEKNLTFCSEPSFELCSGRNLHLYVAALYDLATRLMQGVSTGNCKSSKDRKSAELIMADAMLEYYHTYGKLPKYNAEGQKRQQFVDIFARIYRSRHHQALAHDNSPGSAGIKDEGILDKDIKAALGESYTASKRAANMNKPGTFTDKHFVKKFPLLFNLFACSARAPSVKKFMPHLLFLAVFHIYHTKADKPSFSNAIRATVRTFQFFKAATTAARKAPTASQSHEQKAAEKPPLPTSGPSSLHRLRSTQLLP